MRMSGPSDGPAVLLLHGWPYDIHSYAEVAPLLAARRVPGGRAVPARVRHDALPSTDAAVRNGQQAALAVDASRCWTRSASSRRSSPASTGAHGPRTSWRRCGPSAARAMVSVSGYLIGSQAANRTPLPPAAELSWWYQYYFATERGRAGYDRYRREFARLIWHTASPSWAFDDATFDRSAAAFDNPDHVDIVIHNYRWRLGLADGEPQYDELERRLAEGPTIARAHDHPRGRRQRRAAPRSQRLRGEVHRAGTSTAPSPAASGTTCPRRHPRPSPTPCWTSPGPEPPCDQVCAGPACRSGRRSPATGVRSAHRVTSEQPDHLRVPHGAPRHRSSG